ncbi:MAG TPA: hypothetical protein PKZ52_04485 [Cellvibrionaceae bacterium]|nr:hypothetical protein [Cellvibrionaceae bacterium]
MKAPAIAVVNEQLNRRQAKITSHRLTLAVGVGAKFVNLTYFLDIQILMESP